MPFVQQHHQSVSEEKCHSMGKEQIYDDVESGNLVCSITLECICGHLLILWLQSTERIEHHAQTGSPASKALVRKQDYRILPLCAFIYLLCYLDRSNIGNAKVLNAATKNDLLTETHMTNYQYTIALMVFLIAYALFEVPSNYLLKKLSPSRWIAFLMFSWGAITIGLGGVHSFASVTVVRFLLGVFEAGLFPGLVYYLSESLHTLGED